MHVLEARNLTAADSDGTSDPYAVLHLSSDASATQTTKTVSSSLNPEWGEVFAFDGGREADSVTVCVYDYDYIGRDDPIGEVQISVQDAARQFVAYGAEGRWHRLSGEDAGEGEVRLGFEVDPVPASARTSRRRSVRHSIARRPSALSETIPAIVAMTAAARANGTSLIAVLAPTPSRLSMARPAWWAASPNQHARRGNRCQRPI